MAKLLIVDDEVDVRDFAANFFRKRKVEVSVAASGEEALVMLQANRPDLVLLDIQMSGIDGIETLRRIRAIDQDLKVLMVTGKKPQEDGSLQECLKHGVLDYVHKPLELGELERIVMAILKGTG